MTVEESRREEEMEVVFLLEQWFPGFHIVWLELQNQFVDSDTLLVI